MSVKITPDRGGPSPFRKLIVSSERIPNTRVGHNVVLECGHKVQIFGNLEMARAGVICEQCQDEAGHGR